MSHETLQVFEEEKNTIKEYSFWKLLISNRSRTLGNCVLIIKRDVHRFSELTEEEVVELGVAVKEVENALQGAFRYDKINWLMLMMKEPQVHFHVIPRYKEPRECGGKNFVDGFQPSPLTMEKLELTQEMLDLIKNEINKSILGT